jgi:hypothetical protein
LLRVSSSARRDDENYWRYFEEEQRSDAKEIAAKADGSQTVRGSRTAQVKPTAKRGRSLTRLLPGGTSDVDTPDGED